MKISIITVSYNCVETIEETIKSVLAQEYENIEYIVIDGASTDGTQDVIKQYTDRISLYISEPDAGMYDALNKGIKLATGDVVGILHADDVFASNSVIEKVVECFNSQTIDCCWGDLTYVGKTDLNVIVRYWKSSEYSDRRMKKGWMMPHPTLFIRKKVFDTYGYYDTSFSIAADYEFILRLLYVHKISGAYVDAHITKMRVGGVSNRTIKTIICKTCEDIRAWKKNHLSGGMKAVFFKNISKIPQFFVRVQQSS